MATLEPEMTDALNAVLEDERACVEISVALANGATETRETEAFTDMGTTEVLACCALRERLTEAGAPVTMRINGAVWRVLNVEAYDERLQAYAAHQAAIRDGASELLGWITDEEANRVVKDIVESHAHWVGWLENRAKEFATTRDLDFSVPRLQHAHAQADRVGDVDPGGEDDLAAGGPQSADEWQAANGNSDDGTHPRGHGADDDHRAKSDPDEPPTSER